MVNKLIQTIRLSGIVLALVVAVAAQNRTFIPVEGATLKAKIDSAVVAGRGNTPGGRFWVAYQFETRPGVATDFEVVDGNGGIYF